MAARNPLEFWLGKSINNVYLRVAIIGDSGQGILIYPFSLNGKQWRKIKEQEILSSGEYWQILVASLLDDQALQKITRTLVDNLDSSLTDKQWLRNFFLDMRNCPLTSYQLVNMALCESEVPICVTENLPVEHHVNLPFSLSLNTLAENFLQIKNESYDSPTPPVVQNFLRDMSPEENQLYIRKIFSCTAKYRDMYQLQTNLMNALQSGYMDISNLPTQEQYARAIFLGIDGKNYLAEHVKALLTDWDTWLRAIESNSDALVFPLVDHTEKLNILNKLVFGKHCAYRMIPPKINRPARVFLDQIRNQRIIYKSTVLTRENLSALNNLPTTSLLEILDVIDQKGVNNTFINKVQKKINKILAARQHVDNFVGN